MQSYLRYMDDVAIFAGDKASLWALLDAVRQVVEGRLGLKLKGRATRVAPVTEGVPWLGMRVFPGLIRLDHTGRKRFGRRLGASLRAAQGGDEAAEGEIARAASLCGHVAHADTLSLRQSILGRLDPRPRKR